MNDEILKELKKNNKLKVIDIILKIILILGIFILILFLDNRFNLIYNKIDELDIESINANIKNLENITNEVSEIVDRVDLSTKVDGTMDTIDGVVEKGNEAWENIKDGFTNQWNEINNYISDSMNKEDSIVNEKAN